MEEFKVREVSCKTCQHAIGEWNPMANKCELLCEKSNRFVEPNDYCVRFKKATGSDDAS